MVGIGDSSVLSDLISIDSSSGFISSSPAVCWFLCAVFTWSKRARDGPLNEHPERGQKKISSSVDGWFSLSVVTLAFRVRRKSLNFSKMKKNYSFLCMRNGRNLIKYKNIWKKKSYPKWNRWMFPFSMFPQWMWRQIHIVAFVTYVYHCGMVTLKMHCDVGSAVEIDFTIVATFQIEPFYEFIFFRQRNFRDNSFLLCSWTRIRCIADDRRCSFVRWWWNTCRNVCFFMILCVVFIQTGFAYKITLALTADVTEIQMLLFVVCHCCITWNKYAVAQRTLFANHQHRINFAIAWLIFIPFWTVAWMMLQCPNTSEWHRTPGARRKFLSMPGNAMHLHYCDRIVRVWAHRTCIFLTHFNDRNRILNLSIEDNRSGPAHNFNWSIFSFYGNCYWMTVYRHKNITNT